MTAANGTPRAEHDVLVAGMERQLKLIRRVEREMGNNRASTVAAWLVATAVIAAVVAMVSSPRTRSNLASFGSRVMQLLDRGAGTLQVRLQGQRGRRMAALEEISQTLDAATSQYDSSMTVTKVSGALAEDPSLRGRKVGVRIIGGILHLEGEVRNQHEKLRAGEVAKRASGAELVANDLKIVSQIS